MFHESQKIGGYILISRLGKGGFGEVWLAEKRSQFVTKKVAVKLPLDEQINFDAVRQEAELWEQASGHPNVLPIIDADVYDGQVVIVSEYADGGSLYDLLKTEGKLPVKQAVELTIGILSGLEFLHHKRIIHRDIKPQNILLQGNTPRLADFGISRAMNTSTISSTIIGTDAYMSPEAFEGKRSVQTDIWAVGVVLYQLLTGVLPFPQEHPTERMFAILMKDFEFPPDDTPRELQKIIKTALAKNPDERFQTASAMREELKDFLHSVSPPKTMLPAAMESAKPVIEQNFPLPDRSRREIIPNTVQVVPPSISQTPQAAQTIAFKSADPPPAEIKKTKSFAKPLVIVSLAVLLLVGISTAGYFVYQKAFQVFQPGGVKNDSPAAKNTKDNPFGSLSKEEMELMLEDINPATLKKLKEDPKVKSEQLDSIRQMLALASEARKDPAIYDDNMQKALETINSVIWARTYDQEINKDKASTTPFSSITENQVKEFYGEGANQSAEQRQHNKEFEEFLEVQLNFARRNKSVPENTEPTSEEKAQMRQEFAKIKIYETAAKEKVKSGALPGKFVKKVELQVKLQQAQFLSRTYSTEVLAKKAEVTDEDVRKYIAEHPELNKQESKKAKGNEVLQRLKKGEDFAKLAKEFSDDPGSKDKGGLYEGVTEGGGFDKTFETAALALQPGQISSELVETPFGYHILKLERKGEAKDQSGQVKQSYDVRHILFSTMVRDPENPMSRDMPVDEYAKEKLKEEKEKKFIDKMIADNQITVAEDFVIRDVTDEEIRKYQQQNPQQMPNAQSNSNTKK